MIRSLDTRPTGIEDLATDEAAIRALFAELLAAWACGDGRGYGALFTEGAPYVAFDGSVTTGRQAIADAHQPLFDRWLKGTRLVGQIDTLRFLGPESAVVVATGATLMPGQDRPVRPSRHWWPSSVREPGALPPSRTRASSSATPCNGCSSGSGPSSSAAECAAPAQRIVRGRSHSAYSTGDVVT